MALIGQVISDNATSFRNKIINGNFDVWQRGTTAGPTAGFVSDRWYFSADTNASWSSSRQSFTVGQTDVPDNPTYFLRITTGASNLQGTLFKTRIESVRTLAGQSAVLSFWAKVTSGTMTPSYMRLNQNFGTGGSPSAIVSNDTISTLTTITTSWQKFTYRFNVSSISGKTLGTNNDDYLEVAIRIPDNTNISLDIAQVQLEIGTVASSFEVRPIGVELALCQRYYQEYPYHGVVGQGQVTDRNSGSFVAFAVPMRTTPTTSAKNYDVDIGDLNVSFTPLLYTDRTGQGIGFRPYRNVSTTITRGDTMDILGGERHPFSAEL